jgi:replication initiation and membrane attachment protein DnaB
MIPLTCALSVQKKYDFPIDTYILNEIYKKIIGNEAIGLFFSLDAIFKKNKDNRIELIAFLKKENINNEKFNELKAKLESVDLIGAYTSESNDLLVILNQTKRIEEVFSNNEFNELLKSKCEQDEYEELKYRFDLFIPQNFINISSDISVLLEKNNIDTDLFKIENVQREINAYFKRIVIMPQEIKNLLINN